MLRNLEKFAVAVHNNEEVYTHTGWTGEGGAGTESAALVTPGAIAKIAGSSAIFHLGTGLIERSGDDSQRPWNRGLSAGTRMVERLVQGESIHYSWRRTDSAPSAKVASVGRRARRQKLMVRGVGMPAS